MGVTTIGQTYHVRDNESNQQINLTEIAGVDPGTFGIRFEFNAGTDDVRKVEVTFDEATAIAECIRKITTSRKAVEDTKADEEMDAKLEASHLRSSQFQDGQ